MSFDPPPLDTPLPEDMSSSLEALLSALEQRDATTNSHCARVTGLALALGRQCDLDAKRLDHLVLAARFHDIGKIGIPDRVLLNPDRLDEQMWKQMRRHPEQGAAIFRATRRDDAGQVAFLIRHHHEAWDGGGYPDGLAGSDIPLECRVLSTVDAYDAMVTKRPYRGPMPHAEVMRILGDAQGRELDPDVFRVFEANIARWHAPAR